MRPASQSNTKDERCATPRLTLAIPCLRRVVQDARLARDERCEPTRTDQPGFPQHTGGVDADHHLLLHRHEGGGS